MPAPLNHPPYPGCETGGRPKKYTDEFIEIEAIEFEKWMKLDTSIYFKRFAISRGYHPNRLLEFAEQNEKFSGVFELAKAWQECKLAEGGLMNTFNSTFTKFVMANIFGWTDKVESKISGDASNPLAFILNSIDGKTKDLISDE